jgi:hypothetical protein
MTLVHGRIPAEEIIIPLAVYIPYKNAFCPV